MRRLPGLLPNEVSSRGSAATAGASAATTSSAAASPQRTRLANAMIGRRCAAMAASMARLTTPCNGRVLLIGRADPLIVEAVLMHGMGLAHEDVGRNLVLGAAKFPARSEQDQVIESLFRQREIQRARFRAVFGPSHPDASQVRL